MTRHVLGIDLFLEHLVAVLDAGELGLLILDFPVELHESPVADLGGPLELAIGKDVAGDGQALQPRRATSAAHARGSPESPWSPCSLPRSSSSWERPQHTPLRP